ncbi:MAG: GNAT family N-acetyltransferase [Muribaculaceae bacterium]|nr:GNAT family N-acetyltransferase [Muribaculaceae bacterium]
MTNNSKYLIEKGNSADIEAIAHFQVEMAMESEGTSLSLERVTRGVTMAMDDEAKGQYIVARCEGKVVGSLMLTREWSDWNCQWYWWIQSVYVEPRHRGKGVYRAMYERVKQMARNENVSQVRLYVDKTNNTAQQAYQHLGMGETHYLMYEEEI